MTPERFISTKEFQDWGPEWKTGFFSRLSGVPRKDNPYKDAGFRAVWNGGWDRADALMKEAEEESPEQDSPFDCPGRIRRLERNLESLREAVAAQASHALGSQEERLAELEKTQARSPRWSDVNGISNRLAPRIRALEVRFPELDQKIEATADALEAALAEKGAAKEERGSRAHWQSGILPDRVRAFAKKVAEEACEADPDLRADREQFEPVIADIVMRELQLETVFTLHPAAGPWETGAPRTPGKHLIQRGNGTTGIQNSRGADLTDPQIKRHARIYLPDAQEPTDE